MLLDVLVIYNIRVVNYLASFHKNVIFVKTRYCFIYPPSLAGVEVRPCTFVNRNERIPKMPW